MSAPEFIWIKSYPPCDEALGATYRKMSDDEYDTRYLRADLTCGECQVPWGFRASDCPREFIFPTSKHMIKQIQELLDAQPACMKFVPRKVQP